MVNNHYRWDFIGLSTDDKPTSETSEKVVNGSTFYCSDTSKLYVYCDGTWYERKPLGGGGGGGTSDFDELDNRPKYNNATMTSSTNIPLVPTKTSDLDNDSGFITSSSLPTVNDATLTITQNGTSVGTFTANDADDTTIAVTDTTYSNFTGTDGTSAGAAGLVPAPATTDAGKFLKADGTWDTAGGGSIIPVQAPGDSTTDVMSQNAVTSMLFADPVTQYKIKIGAGTSTSEGNDGIEIGHNAAATKINSTAVGVSASATGARSTAIGQASIAQSDNSLAVGSAGVKTSSPYGIAIGYAAEVRANAQGAVAIGDNSLATVKGQFDISTLADGASSTRGYNNSPYRLISGVYDGQSAHDAVTVGQVNSVIDAINTALSTNIPHIGA